MDGHVYLYWEAISFSHQIGTCIFVSLVSLHFRCFEGGYRLDPHAGWLIKLFPVLLTQKQKLTTWCVTLYALLPHTAAALLQSKLFSVSLCFICENRIPQFGRATHIRLLMQLVGTSDITKPFILLWVYCQCSALCVTFFEGESLTIDFDGLLHPFITQAGWKSCRRYFCQRWYDI